MKSKIKKVAILGSGIMGSAIACHLANAGMEVLLLDMIDPRLNNTQKKIRDFRNKMVNESLAKTIKSKPAPLFKNSLVSNIQTGNFEDDLHRISEHDWIIEVILEDLKIKQTLYDLVETFRKPGSIISTNTSGIPIHQLVNGKSDDFKKHFLGTHFFNPPRYLRLMEIIPGAETAPEIIDHIMEFGRRFLGKQTVLCKDTPAFISNRIGIFSITKLIELTDQFDLDIESVDALTGPAIGRPKTGTFRLQDLIGIDVGAHVLKSVIDNCPEDEYLQSKKSSQALPYLTHLIENRFFGNKTGQGFYKKTDEKDEFGRSKILAFDLKTLSYREKNKVKIDSVRTAKKIDNLNGKINSFFENEDIGGKFIQAYFLSLFSYAASRIPEISDGLFSIDDAMKAGYAWEAGPFEYWDMIGVKKGLDLAKDKGYLIPDWVDEMLQSGCSQFYKFENGRQFVYDIESRSYKILPGSEYTVQLHSYKEKLIFKNTEARIYDIGDDVICLEFNSKNNIIGEGTGEAMNKALDLAEEEHWKAIVIGNNSPNFSVGANLMLVAMLAYQKEWDKLNDMAAGFQDVNMRMRYSKIPVVTATQGYVFGGGVELSMHTDAVVAAAESYFGLVEAGVGLLPGGGGTKEFALRLSDEIQKGGIETTKLTEMFKTIAMAEVATSAPMAFDMKYLLPERDKVVLNAPWVIHEAKNKALQLAESYVPPSAKKVRVLGRSGLAALYTAVNEFKLGNFISEHDALIANKIAQVMCGGDLTSPQYVSEQYLLDIEREAFISLLGETKTQERIQYMLQFNKPLRN